MLIQKMFFCGGSTFGGGCYKNCNCGNKCNEYGSSPCDCHNDNDCGHDKCCLTKLGGAKFVLINECGKEIACGVTNANGELLFDCLPCGKYCLKEIEAPCGYCKNNEVIEICVSGDKLNRHVEVINERQSGSIKITKLGR